MRLPLGGVVAGTLVLALGVAGFVRGAVPASSSASSAGRIVVTNATIAATSSASTTASFTVYNTSGRDDRIAQIACGAGASVTVRSNPVIPARGQRVVTVVVSQLFGPLLAGQTVDLQIDFRTASSQGVTAKVVPQVRQAQSPQPSSGAPS